jgi:hypothetical protein
MDLKRISLRVESGKTRPQYPCSALGQKGRSRTEALATWLRCSYAIGISLANVKVARSLLAVNVSSISVLPVRAVVVLRQWFSCDG